MKKFFLIFLIICLSGCGATHRRGRSGRVSASGYMHIDDFCRKNAMQYSYDTIDDIVRVYSTDKEIRVLFNSPVGYFNGSIFRFERVPYYIEGNIFISNELEDVIFSNEAIVFRTPFTIKTIVVDPGHGGKDPGAISSGGLREKRVNLKIAKYLAAELTKRGFKTILTRSRDAFLTLQQRTNVAKNNNADLFVSVHTNSNRSRYVKGTEIYYLLPGKLASSKRSVKVAKNRKIWPKNKPFEVKAILWDLLITKNYFFSVDMAHIFYHTFKDLGFKIKPPRKANYHVLREAYVPAVLVETGYLSNQYEEKLLRQKYYQKQIAEAIASGVVALNKQHAGYAREAE
ncbi:MAG: N-acetylmuramoyl-L-alanine amidase [Candidatus Omnitrophica bacterium]|nr:N-acetylmuramoyl-L-alanine amidase [Candidatus Omnitrophota bacterium]